MAGGLHGLTAPAARNITKEGNALDCPCRATAAGDFLSQSVWARICGKTLKNSYFS